MRSREIGILSLLLMLLLTAAPIRQISGSAAANTDAEEHEQHDQQQQQQRRGEDVSDETTTTTTYSSSAEAAESEREPTKKSAEDMHYQIYTVDDLNNLAIMYQLTSEEEATDAVETAADESADPELLRESRQKDDQDDTATTTGATAAAAAKPLPAVDGGRLAEMFATLSKRIRDAELVASEAVTGASEVTDLLLFGDDNPYDRTAEADAASRQPPTAFDLEMEDALRSHLKGHQEWQLARARLSVLVLSRHAPSRAQYAWMLLLGGGSISAHISGLIVTRPAPMRAEDRSAHRQAVRLLEEAARDGDAAAHTGLAYAYAIGLGRPVSQARAVLHYTLAAQGDDPWALMALGYRYYAGVGVPANCERALSMYKRVAVRVAAKVRFGGGNAVHRARLLDEAENTGVNSGFIDNDLIEYYQLLADKGDVQSQVGLGQLHYQGGRGMQLDLQKALQYFTPAAAAGNAVAMGYLGKIYLEGNAYVEASNETAFKYFTKAAELGNPVGQSGLGVMYLQGKGVPRDTAKAYSYFTQAAEQGWVDGQLQLGNMYFTGTGVKRDLKMANKYFTLASQSGHVLAYYNLGQMHANGLGVIRSCPTAVELFKNVAERGPWNERLMNAHQDHKAYRFDMAYRKYALAAEMGYEVGQSNAAYLLDRADVPLFDDRHEELVRALQMWGRAAAQGYSQAQVKLGDYHYYGLGTHVDYDAAASHYRTASEQHHNPQAMFNMGYMHEQGLGMKRDWHLAKRCYDQAAATHVDAKVPVALALLKLSAMFQLENLHDFNVLGAGDAWLEISDHMLANWDLYLISVVTIVCGLFIYLQRPDDGRIGNRAPVQQQQQQQPEAAAAEADAAAPAAARPADGGGDQPAAAGAAANDIQ